MFRIPVCRRVARIPCLRCGSGSGSGGSRAYSLGEALTCSLGLGFLGSRGFMSFLTSRLSPAFKCWRSVSDLKRSAAAPEELRVLVVETVNP